MIGDLLASITGEKPSSTKAPPAVPVKRKPDDDLRGGSAQKTQRTVQDKTPYAQLGPDTPRYSIPAPERSTSGYSGTSRQPNNGAPRPLAVAERSVSRKPLATPSNPSPTARSFSGTSRPAPPSRLVQGNRPPVASATPTDSASKAQPKKGSYAEVKARAAANAQKIQQMGKIQHKAVEKTQSKKDRNAQEQRAARNQQGSLAQKPGARPGASTPSRSGTPGARGNGNGMPDRTRPAGQLKTVTGRATKAPVEEPLKRKKSAVATTGYTGTARPRPEATSKPGAAKAAPGSGSRVPDRPRQPNPMGMFGGRRRRDEEDDEDMDGFIEYDDDDEDGYGGERRNVYSDEDESDMEAGFSDVDQEESKAARLARLEDQREEAILEQRRREKEARKKALQGRR